MDTESPLPASARAAPPVATRMAPAPTRIFDPAVLWLLASAAGFGAMAIFAKLAYAGGLNLPTLLAARFSLAALLMWALLAVRRRPVRVPPRTLAGLLVMGAAGYVGQSFSYFTALQTIPAATTALLLYTYPALVNLLAWVLLKQPLTGRSLAALVLASAGCILVLGGSSGPGAASPLDPGGAGWALAAAVVYSLYIIAGARVTAGVHPLVAATYIISAAAAVFLGAGLLGGTLQLRVAPAGWAALGAIAVVCTVLPIAAFFAGLARLGPARASILSTVEPAVTLVLAALVLGESLGPAPLLGGALIVSAVLVLQWPRRGGQASAGVV